METLKKIIESPFSEVEIDLEKETWIENVPSEAGWYYLTTNAPFTVFLELSAPPSEYANADGEMKKCRNYNLSARASRHSSEIGRNSIVINGVDYYAIYSGYAKNLKTRSNEHTFAHPGTAGLALARYDELKKYKWSFYYKSINSEKIEYVNRDVVLKMGEQIWRSVNGWPLLCSE